jgi:hypothetical protein
MKQVILLLLILHQQALSSYLKLKINVGKNQFRELHFNTTSDPTISAHRFCARHGILDDQCQSIATKIAKIQAETSFGLHISKPAQGEQIIIPFTYPFQLTAFHSPHATNPQDPDSKNSMAEITNNFTTCLILKSTLTGGTETVTETCMQGKLPSTFPVSFKNVGYHFAKFLILPINITASVAFTSVSNKDSSAKFFDVFCDSIKSGEPPPHPMTRRPMAMLDEELMFRSTGTSNPGHNFPKIWLPSSGLSPEWFLNVYSPMVSFRDINQRKINLEKGTILHIDRSTDDLDHQSRKILWSNALNVFTMIDKRFSLGSLHYFCTIGKYQPVDNTGRMYNYNASMCKNAIDWAETKNKFSKEWQENKLVNEKLAIQSGSGDTLKRGRYLLDRFYSIRTMAVSIRLGSCAWRANGYWEAAKHILKIANEMGIETKPVVREDIRDKIFAGLCDVNQFIHHDLGFHIDGWEMFYVNACLGGDGNLPKVEL